MPRRPPRVDQNSGARVALDAQRRLDVLEQPDAGQTGRRLRKLEEILAAMPDITVAVSTGTVTASVSVSSPVVATTTLYAAGAPGTVHTGGRVAGWWLTANGLAGTATSSERFKQDIRSVRDDPSFDPFAVLDLEMDYWVYIDEVRKRDDPTFVEYVGPEYHVATNFGPIAERAHELGLWMIVVYEREMYSTTSEHGDPITLERLKLDEQGEPIPFALHDSLFAYVLHVAVQEIRREQRVDRAMLREVVNHLGLEWAEG